MLRYRSVAHHHAGGQQGQHGHPCQSTRSPSGRAGGRAAARPPGHPPALPHELVRASVPALSVPRCPGTARVPPAGPQHQPQFLPVLAPGSQLCRRRSRSQRRTRPSAPLPLPRYNGPSESLLPGGGQRRRGAPAGPPQQGLAFSAPPFAGEPAPCPHAPPRAGARAAPPARRGPQGCPAPAPARGAALEDPGPGGRCPRSTGRGAAGGGGSSPHSTALPGVPEQGQRLSPRGRGLPSARTSRILLPRPRFPISSEN